MIRRLLLACLLAGWGVAAVAQPGQPPADPVPSSPPLATPTLAPPPPAPDLPSPDLPSPDLGGLEPAVATQLSEARQDAQSVLGVPSTPPAARAEAWGELGRVYHAYGLLGPAIVCYRAAAGLGWGDHRWPYLLGHVLRAAGDLDAASEAFRSSLALTPYPPALVALAEVELARGNPAAAADAARAALAASAGDAAAHAALGQAVLADRQWSEAIAALEAALAAAPGADRLHYPLALAYRGMGDEARARDHLARAGQAGVRSADPLLDTLDQVRRGELAPLLRGRRAAGAGDWAAAEREFRRALAANPKSVPARINLAAALAAQGDRGAASAELAAVLEREPGSATASFNLGVLLLGDGDAAAALPHLVTAARALPRDGEALRSLGEALLALDRVEEALPPLRAAVEAAPTDEAARVDEAAALLRLGRLAEARGRLEETVRDLPDAGRPAHLLARLLAASPDLALRDGARAVELAGQVWTARPALDHGRTLALALAEAGRCAEAASLAGRLAAEAPAPHDAPLRRDAELFAAGPPCRPPAEPSP